MANRNNDLDQTIEFIDLDLTDTIPSDKIRQEVEKDYQQYEDDSYGDDYEDMDGSGLDTNATYANEHEADVYDGRTGVIEFNEEHVGNEVFSGEVSMATVDLLDVVAKAGDLETDEYGYDDAGTEYYTDEEYEEEYQDEQYSDEPYEYGDEEYYSDDEYEEYYEEDYVEERKNPSKKSKKRQSKIGAFFSGIKDKISSMTPEDWTIAGGAIIVLAVAIVVIVAVGGNKKETVRKEATYAIGNSLSAIGVPGQNGLVAMGDAARALVIAVEEEVEEEVLPATNEIKVSFTSVEKDIKIKFADTGTGKLITGIEFEVVLKDKSGKETTLKDEDKDGIIYKNKMTSGDYTVSISPVDGYSFTGYDSTINIKDAITYKQIDVVDEIKKESEINVAAEDTANNVVDVVEEAPTLTDTVEWVESTKTATDGSDNGYKAIDKGDIKVPDYSMLNVIGVKNEYAAYIPMYVKHTLVRDPEPGEGEDPTPEPEEKPTPTPEEKPTSTPEEKPTPTPTSTPTPTPSASPSPSPSPSPSVSPSPSASPTVESVSLASTQETLAVNGTYTIAAKAVMSDKTEVTTGFTYSTDNSKVATVDSTGKVTAVAKGTANITVSYKDSKNNTKSAVLKITVNDLTVSSFSITPTSLTVAMGNTATISATAVMADQSKITDASKFLWKSSNDKIATVDASGKVTGVAKGDATVTVTYTDASGVAKSATCAVKVVQNPEKDTTTKLKDKNGNQVYVKDSNGKYREATYADYYTAKEFFILTEANYRYTGWQTINGNVYFFDKNGNKVTGEQVIQGVKYTFTEDGVLAMDKNGKIGIDVSKWNGNIDWNAVKNSGVSFVIIRCGYRGSSSGALIEDSKFKSNIQGATAAGLKVGIYFFTQAVNEVEAVEEASMVLSLIKGYGISYPVFIDTERAGGRADSIDRNTRTAVCRAFCETIRSGGYSAGVYASKSWYNDNLNYSSLSGYKIWLAQYASAPTFANRYDMWQHTEKGSVNGIGGKVDMNISYMGY